MCFIQIIQNLSYLYNLDSASSWLTKRVFSVDNCFLVKTKWFLGHSSDLLSGLWSWYCFSCSVSQEVGTKTLTVQTGSGARRGNSSQIVVICSGERQSQLRHGIQRESLAQKQSLEEVGAWLLSATRTSLRCQHSVAYNLALKLSTATAGGRAQGNYICRTQINVSISN